MSNPPPPPLPVQALSYDTVPPPKHKLTMAIVCLHVSAGLYLLIVIGIMMFPHMDTAERVIIGGVSLVMIAVPEVVAWGLMKRKYWAWVAGLVIFGLYAPSLFFILGGLGLWGLLDPGSRAQFGRG